MYTHTYIYMHAYIYVHACVYMCAYILASIQVPNYSSHFKCSDIRLFPQKCQRKTSDCSTLAWLMLPSSGVAYNTARIHQYWSPGWNAILSSTILL